MAAISDKVVLGINCSKSSNQMEVNPAIRSQMTSERYLQLDRLAMVIARAFGIHLGKSYVLATN